MRGFELADAVVDKPAVSIAANDNDVDDVMAGWKIAITEIIDTTNNEAQHNSSQFCERLPFVPCELLLFLSFTHDEGTSS